jgi:hypothetical protein
LPPAFNRHRKRFRMLPERFRMLAERKRELPGRSLMLPRSFRMLPKGLRELPRRLREHPQCFRLHPLRLREQQQPLRELPETKQKSPPALPMLAQRMMGRQDALIWFRRPSNLFPGPENVLPGALPLVLWKLKCSLQVSWELLACLRLPPGSARVHDASSR